MAEEHLYHPKINAKSLQLLEKSDKDLIEASKMKKIQKQQTVLEQRAQIEKFQPRINAISQQLNKGVDLVQDAARRQQTKKQISDMLQMKSSMDKNAAQISSKSDKVMYDRFDQDFVRICQ